MKLQQAMWACFVPVTLGSIIPLSTRDGSSNNTDATAYTTTSASQNSLGEVVTVCSAFSPKDLPLVEDCLLALVQIPLSIDKRRASETWRPQNFDNGRCHIGITPKPQEDLRQSKVSWMEISITATQLLTGCTRGFLGSQRTGGQLERPEWPFIITISKLARGTGMSAVNTMPLVGSGQTGANVTVQPVEVS